MAGTATVPNPSVVGPIQAGFIVPEDAASTVSDAAQSDIGKR